MQNRHIQAIIWDYDGTLVNTHLKNYNVTKSIVQDLTGIEPELFPALVSLEDYLRANDRATNWRDLYEREFRFTEDQIDCAGKCWTEYQLHDNTPVAFFDGIIKVISAYNSLAQGIVSQNSRNSIVHQLMENNIAKFFTWIVGYEEVDLTKQKPHPDGLLLCIEKLTHFAPGHVVYIGDHETDLRCALNATRLLISKNIDIRVVTIGALYKGNNNVEEWNLKPDYVANDVQDILGIIHSL